LHSRQNLFLIAAMSFQNLIHLKDFERGQVDDLMETAFAMKRGSVELPLFFGKKPILATFFLENSTRTKLSFAVAAKRLGAEVLDFPVSSSSLSKGESLEASFQCLEAFGVNGIVFRGSESVLTDISTKIKTPIVSGGEGNSGHPTQALLDYMSFLEDFQSLEGKRLLIAGDLKHSRVFASHRELAKLMNLELVYSGPDHFLPKDGYGVKMDFDEAIESSDMIMLLRVQKERHQAEANDGDYNQNFGLNQKNLEKIKPSAKIYHPGPYNLGVEITEDVLKDARCRIWDQVENGVYLRMAVLKNILGDQKQ
tara:strand:+ start:6737 stop:7666 length:930 start_codon:yes stop_codon:yes gene_type:complete